MLGKKIVILIIKHTERKLKMIPMLGYEMEMNSKLRAKEIKTYFGDKPFNSDDLYNFYANYEPDLNLIT